MVALVDANSILILAGHERLCTIVEPARFKIQSVSDSRGGHAYLLGRYEHRIDVAGRSAGVVGNRHGGSADDEHFASNIKDF